MRDALTALALSPVLVPQVLWVKSRAMVLQEAAGARDARTGEGPALRVLIVGDSSGAGVGVETQKDALAGRLAAHLGTRFDVHWTLVARCGATVGSITKELDALPEVEFDIAVVALGVNDSKNGHARSVWQCNYAQLVATLRSRFNVTDIYASGIPDLEAFPLLPWPLNRILGRRAEAFDQDLQAMVAADPAFFYVPMDFPMDPELMAEDGFHPGPKVYDAWALRVAKQIFERT